MPVQVVVLWWVACFLWSSTFLFIRLGLDEIPPFTFAWIRLALALAVLGPIAAARGSFQSLTWWDVRHILFAGVLLLGLNYALIFWGAQFVPSGLVAILQAGTPVLALIFGWMLGSERVTVRKVVALALGLTGVTIVVGAEAQTSGRLAVAGAAAIVGGSASVAFAYVWLKRHPRRLQPFAVTTLQAAAGLAPLACLAFALEGSPAVTTWSPSAWGALLYLAIGASVLAFWLNYWLLARMDASAMLLMGVAEVPIAVALGAWVFRERLPAGTLLGGACVLAAVIVGLANAVDERPEGRPADG